MRTAPLHKTKIIALVSGGILLLLLILSFFLPSQNRDVPPDSSKRPSVTFAPSTDNTQNTPEIPVFRVQQETILEGVTEDGSPWKTTLFADPDNPEWQTNKPTNIAFSYDPNTDAIVVIWTDPMLINTAYSWLIGYAPQPFDPVEKFDQDSIASIFWEEADETPNTYNTVKNRENVIVLENLSSFSSSAYFYLYKRLPEKNGTFQDFLYGAEESAHVPFVAPLY